MQNRIIKFRVWDVKLNKFFITENGVSATEPDSDQKKIRKQLFCSRKLGEKYGFCSFYPTNCNNLIFQQFTGLIDGNDKEIYEGDIVSVKYYDDWDDNVGFDVVYLVKWCDTHVGFRGFTKRMLYDKSSGSGMPAPILILGNIYENPEFLEKV